MTVCTMNFIAKIYTRISIPIKMNCWRNVADKFDMSPEDAEKSQDHSPFFSAITLIIWKPVDR